MLRTWYRNYTGYNILGGAKKSISSKTHVENQSEVNFLDFTNSWFPPKPRNPALYMAVVFFGMLWLPTLPILTLLSSDFMLDQSISYGIVLSSYVGLFLLGSMLLSVGIFTSSITDNVLLAAIIAMIFNVMMIMAPGFVHPRLEEWFGDTYMVNAFIEQTSVFDHLRHWFGRGMIDSRKVMFYLGGCALFLFLTVRALESRKWQ